MNWNTKGKTTESADGRFYIISKGAYCSLYDTRNRLAGGVTCDTLADAKELAEKIAA